MPGKKGNKNALKHGIFSQFIAVVEDKQMQKMKSDRNTAELAYARTRLAHAQNEVEKAVAAEDKLKWDYACRHWTEIILNAINSNLNKVQTENMVFETLIDALRAANDKQHVQR